MDKIFDQENQMLEAAEKLLENGRFDSPADREEYRLLYEEYKTLLRQTVKVVHLADLVQRELKTVTMKLEKVSQTDELTSLYNRMYFMSKYTSEWKSAVRTGTSVSFLMIDIDFFKQYNDTYGHAAGDRCLQAIGRQLRRNARRPRDMVARFGGDEFVVLLPETGIDGAEMIAQNILNDVRRLNLEHRGAPGQKKVTLSVGISAAVPKQYDGMESLMQQADQALYQAKSGGRNCFWLYGGKSPCGTCSPGVEGYGAVPECETAASGVSDEV